MLIQTQTINRFESPNDIFMPSDSLRTPKYAEVKSGTSSGFFNMTYLPWHPLLASSQQSSNENELKMKKLREFTSYSLDQTTERWIISLNLVDETYQVAQKVRYFFANRPLILCRDDDPDNTHLIEIWVETSDDLDLEIKTLNRFDIEWWIKQPEDLREKVIVLLR
jgi:hypothetical protein